MDGGEDAHPAAQAQRVSRAVELMPALWTFGADLRSARPGSRLNTPTWAAALVRPLPARTARSVCRPGVDAEMPIHMCPSGKHASLSGVVFCCPWPNGY